MRRPTTPQLGSVCLGFVATAGACSIGESDAAIVPITAIASTDSSTLTVTTLTDVCDDSSTQVAVSERGGQTVTITVRFDGSNCRDLAEFTDMTVQLDGPLGDRALVLVQPAGFADVVGTDVCIVDGQTSSDRCRAEVATES